ncbi:MAG: endonuclease III [Candidatus Aenigmarchaeota archaeon]|nr:endonuclease III [Candidatus Aenigmarchaeota archaeon]
MHLTEKERAEKILSILKKKYPEANTALKHADPLELLVATILSAQCTDVRVNIVTKELFKKYKSTNDYASADLKVLEQQIHSTGFFRNKSKNIIASAKIISEKYGGKVPDTMDELVALPGVARKTANIVLSGAYKKLEGIAVDTHVTRVSFRLSLTKNKDPAKIEQDLMKIIPKKDWWVFSNIIIYHGRETCDARRPKCSICILNSICPRSGVVSVK